MTEKERRRGLVLVHTGDGKGKSTAAWGILLRAYGRGWKCCVIQFLKHEAGRWGEVQAAEKLDIEWIKTGDGFTWTSKDLDETAAKACHGWQVAQEKIRSGGYDLVVLDEFTYPLTYGWIPAAAVVQWLRANRPAELSIVVTGRDAPSELVAYADLVTEMRNVKHPYDLGVLAQPGIDF